MSETVGVVEVRIRHQHDAKSKRLTIWPISTLDDLITEVLQWGVITYYTNGGQIVGQFVVTEGDAPYFEIVIGNDD